MAEHSAAPWVLSIETMDLPRCDDLMALNVSSTIG